jgi:hypothetical protein
MRRVVAERRRDRDRRAHLAGRSCLRWRLPGDKRCQNTIIQNVAQLADMSSVVVRLLMNNRSAVSSTSVGFTS